MLDGMTMFYAAAEKNQSDDARKARDIAYTQGNLQYRPVDKELLEAAKKSDKNDKVYKINDFDSFLQAIGDSIKAESKVKDQIRMSMIEEAEEKAVRAQRDAWRFISKDIIRDSMHCNIAADLLEHSLQDNPNDLLFGDDTEIAKKMKQDIGFVERIDELVEKIEKNEDISTLNYYRFKDGDLYYGINHCNIDIEDIIPRSNGKKDIIVHVYDTYDFTKIMTFVESYRDDNGNLKQKFNPKVISKGTLANDAGLVSTKLGAIKPYEINVYMRIRR